MTTQEAKEYLSQIYAIRQRIKRLEQLRSEIRAEMFAIGSPSNINPDKVQTSLSTDDRTLNLIAKANRLDADIRHEQERLLTQLRKIQKQIEKVQGERYKKILFMRYVECLKWELIAAHFNVDLRWIFRLHGNALDEFAKTFSHDH